MSANKETAKKLILKSRHTLQYKNCLLPLLRALSWHGTQRDYVEALPHFCNSISINRFNEIMERLQFNSDSIKNVSMLEIDERLFPCLFVPNHSLHPKVILQKEDNKISYFDGHFNVQKTEPISDEKGTLYLYKPISRIDQQAKQRVKRGWLSELFLQYRPSFIQAILLSFLFNLFMLAIPLYVMNVYDKVVGASSYSMLRDFMIGIFMVLIALGTLHRLRARLLSFIGAQIDRDVGNAIFRKIMYLAPQYTENVSVESQIARIKDFDHIRDFFTGNLLTTCLDLPFVSLFIITIYFLVGKLALIPLSMVVVFSIVAYLMNKNLQRKTSISAYHNSRRQEFLLESLENMKLLKQISAQDIWEERYRNLSAEAASHNIEVTFAINANNSLSDFLMILSGLSVVAFGIFSVFTGDVTTGALVATMILVWRALTPIRHFFVSLPKIRQFLNSTASLERLMNMPEEVDPSLSMSTESLNVKGFLSFEQVSFRYPGSQTPALVGLNFSLKPGEILMIAGKNGSGKSSLLKLILNLYQPQAGSVLVDHCDIRQINPIQLRQAVAYCPQHPDLFYGTIAQNLRLSEPTADDERLLAACALAGMTNELSLLEEGLDSPVRDKSGHYLSNSFLKKICLARTYVRKSSIILMDEPGTNLDDIGEQQLHEALSRMKKRKTVVMTTHRPSHLKYADKIIVLNKGQVAMMGTYEQVQPKLEAIFQ